MKQPLLMAVFLIIAGTFMQPVLAEVYIWLDAELVKHVSNVKPAWWTEAMDLMEPGSVISPETRQNPGKFIGDRENKKFHWPKCVQIHHPDGQLAIPENKQIWFDDYEGAISQGYYVCDHCQPSEDGPEYQPKTP